MHTWPRVWLWHWLFPVLVFQMPLCNYRLAMGPRGCATVVSPLFPTTYSQPVRGDNWDVIPGNSRSQTHAQTLIHRCCLCSPWTWWAARQNLHDHLAFNSQGWLEGFPFECTYRWPPFVLQCFKLKLTPNITLISTPTTIKGSWLK